MLNVLLKKIQQGVTPTPLLDDVNRILYFLFEGEGLNCRRSTLKIFLSFDWKLSLAHINYVSQQNKKKTLYIDT